MTTLRRAARVALILGGFAPAVSAAQGAPAHKLSLEEALRLAVPANEALAIAREAVERAQGQQSRARSEWFPQFNVSLGYNRLLKSQFEGISFGGENGDSGSTSNLGKLPFGQRNTYNAGLSFSHQSRCR